MKQILFILILLALAGCSTTQDTTGVTVTSDQGETVSEEKSDTSSDGEIEYIVENRDYLYSRIIDSKGRTLMPFSHADKGIIKDIRTHEPAYLFATDFEYLGKKDDYNYEYEQGLIVYDLDGNPVANLECNSFYDCIGDVCVAVDRERTRGNLMNMKTGEVIMENIGGMNDGGNCVILYSLENYKPIYITDYDFNVLFDIKDKYDHIYSPSVYISEKIKGDYLIAFDWSKDSGINVINNRGENLLGRDFETLGYGDGNYLVFEAEGNSYVYDAESLEFIMETPGSISAINDNYYIVDTSSEGDNRRYSLYNRGGSIIRDGEYRIVAHCLVPGKEIFGIDTELKDEKGDIFDSEELIDGTGKVILEGSNYNRGSVSFIGSDGLIVYVRYDYDEETNQSSNTVEMYRRNGERVIPEREYQYIYQASYTTDPDKSYASYGVASYYYKGDEFYALIDKDGKEIISNIKSYQTEDKYMIYTNGFNTYILDMETMENVYSERSFNSLSD